MCTTREIAKSWQASRIEQSPKSLSFQSECPSMSLKDLFGQLMFGAEKVVLDYLRGLFRLSGKWLKWHAVVTPDGKHFNLSIRLQAISENHLSRKIHDLPRGS